MASTGSSPPRPSTSRYGSRRLWRRCAGTTASREDHEDGHEDDVSSNVSYRGYSSGYSSCSSDNSDGEYGKSKVELMRPSNINRHGVVVIVAKEEEADEGSQGHNLRRFRPAHGYGDKTVLSISAV